MKQFQHQMTNDSVAVSKAIDDTLKSLESMVKDLAGYNAQRLDNLNFSLRVLEFFNEGIGVWAPVAENASPIKESALEVVASGMRRTSIQEQSEAMAAQSDHSVETPKMKIGPASLPGPGVSLKDVKGVQLKTPKNPYPCSH
jgi:hypothetical protein